MGSRAKRMVLQVLQNSDYNNTDNPNREQLNSNLIVSIDELILLDENLQPLVTDSFIEENNISLSSIELNQDFVSPKKVIGELK